MNSIEVSAFHPLRIFFLLRDISTIEFSPLRTPSSNNRTLVELYKSTQHLGNSPQWVSSARRQHLLLLLKSFLSRKAPQQTLHPRKLRTTNRQQPAPLPLSINEMTLLIPHKLSRSNPLPSSPFCLVQLPPSADSSSATNLVKSLVCPNNLTSPTAADIFPRFPRNVRFPRPLRRGWKVLSCASRHDRWSAVHWNPDWMFGLGMDLR